MPFEKNHTTAPLTVLLSQDSEHAFQLIFKQYSKKVYAVALMYLKASQAAEEILQDVFLKLWKHRKSMAGTVSLEAWLYTVTKNSILNSLKKQAYETVAKNKFAKQIIDTENATDHKIRDAQYHQLIQEAIANLSRQQQLAFTLAKEEGLTYQQIGTKLSLSSLTVKKHISRALHSIRQFLNEHGETVTCFLFISKKIL